MKILRLAVLVPALLVLAATAWFTLLRPRAPATLLRVEAPPYAVVGQRLPIRVRLNAPEPGTRLGVDLHWATAHREPRGFLSHSPAQRVEGQESTYTFELPASAQDGIGYVYAIVFLSPSGRWEDRIATATSVPIPVRTAGVLAGFEPIAVYDLTIAAAPLAAAVPALRRSIAGLWLLSSIGFWWRRRRAAGSRGEVADAGRSRAGGLALACLAAAVWEVSNVAAWLGRHARSAALEHHLYFERSGPQQGLTLALLVAAVAGILWTLRRSPARTTDLAAAVLWLYAGISLASLLSFHQTDRLLASAVFTVPVVQVAKLTIALATLALALAPALRDARSDRGSRGRPPRVNV